MANVNAVLTAAPTRRISERHREPGWLRELREKAWAIYEAAPLPDRVTHLWRYTAPEPFVPSAEALHTAWEGRQESEGRGQKAPPTREDWPASIAEAWEKGGLAGAAHVLGSRLVRAALGPEAEKAGVVLESLHDAAGVHADRVHPHLATLVGPEFGKFEALNAAVWEGGLFLYVPKRAEIKAPIHLLRDVAGAACPALRLLVVAEEGSAVTIVDEYAGGAAPLDAARGGSGAPQANAVVEIVAGPSSQVRYVAVQGLGRAVVSHFTQRARVERDARFLLCQAALGAAVSKSDTGAMLAGRGADALLLGVAVGEGRQHFDHHTVHDHQVGQTHSDLHFKVVLRDKARSVYTGLIRIARDAVNSEAYQENRNLLLNEGTKAESIPELEILTDEVRCTHGATMGPIDPEHVFYLMCRGVPREDAVRMIVTGFVEPTLARMPADLQARMRRLVSAKLGLTETPESD